MLQQITKQLQKGDVIIASTDTLFALSCDATNNLAIEKIYQYKEREREKKLPILFRDISQVANYCFLPSTLEEFAYKYWPGPLTLLLEVKKNTNLAKNAYNSKENIIAARVPGFSLILDILHCYNQPLIGTSANKSGAANSIQTDELLKTFHTIPLYINNKQPSGVQSTIITLDKNNQVQLVREGAIKIQNLF